MAAKRAGRGAPSIPADAKEPLRPVAYVAMDPSPELEPVFVRVIRPVLEGRGFLCRRNDRGGANGYVAAQVLEYLDEADLIVCDLTGNHAGTYFELGVAQAFRKPTVLLSQATSEIPFDTRYQRALSYKDDRFSMLELRDALDSAVKTLFPDGTTGGPLDQEVPWTVPATHDDLQESRVALFTQNLDAKLYAVRILGDHRDKESYRKIRSMLGSGWESPDLVREAITALQRIDPEAAFDVLFGAHGIQHPDHRVRERVVTLLGNYPKTDYLVRRLMDQIDDSSWGVRVAVCRQLGVWKAKEAEALLQQYRVDPFQAVRAAAEQALMSIGRAHASTGPGPDA